MANEVSPAKAADAAMFLNACSKFKGAGAKTVAVKALFGTKARKAHKSLTPSRVAPSRVVAKRPREGSSEGSIGSRRVDSGLVQLPESILRSLREPVICYVRSIDKEGFVQDTKKIPYFAMKVLAKLDDSLASERELVVGAIEIVGRAFLKKNLYVTESNKFVDAERRIYKFEIHSDKEDSWNICFDISEKGALPIEEANGVGDFRERKLVIIRDGKRAETEKGVVLKPKASPAGRGSFTHVFGGRKLGGVVGFSKGPKLKWREIPKDRSDITTVKKVVGWLVSPPTKEEEKMSRLKRQEALKKRAFENLAHFRDDLPRSNCREFVNKFARVVFTRTSDWQASTRRSLEKEDSVTQGKVLLLEDGERVCYLPKKATPALDELVRRDSAIEAAAKGKGEEVSEVSPSVVTGELRSADSSSDDGSISS